MMVISSSLQSAPSHDTPVVIIGAGSAGVAVAASIKARAPTVPIMLIDPAHVHYYQPGWTLVGGGIFSASKTVRRMDNVIPKGVHWVKGKVATIEPAENRLSLVDGRVFTYEQLIVSPGLVLDWDAIPGLSDALGSHGVTSNYRFDLPPYTWKVTQELQKGRAIFTQPPPPIKCAGAPQKAMYLACDHWRRRSRQGKIDVEFFNAGVPLFGVAAYIPALMEYVEKYAIKLHTKQQLIRVDGPAQVATFRRHADDGAFEIVEQEFDMLHAVPPQIAPDFIRQSGLADQAGWLEVDPYHLNHSRFSNIHGLGDVIGTTNAKTMAAARKQAVVVANNVLVNLGHLPRSVTYDGYGACPLTVERGKVVLAEFTYGGALAPSLPRWMLEGTRPSRAAWLLKAHLLPSLYWHGMLRGKEWLAHPSESA